MLELIINNEPGKNTIMLLENGILIEKHEEHEHRKRLEGNIYIGKVENVLKGMRVSVYRYWRKKKYFYQNTRYSS